MAKRGNPKWEKGKSGNPGGRKKGKSFNAELREALDKKAKKEGFKRAADWLVSKATTDNKLMSKLLDKAYSDAPKDVNIKGEGAKFIVITKGEVEW